MRAIDRSRFLLTVVGAMLLAAPSFATEAPKIGELAPAFTATSMHDKSRSLSDYKGKFVILEWHNQGCPYVVKHYDSGNMQRLQKELTDQGAIWLTVISSAEGKQGFVTSEQQAKYLDDKKAVPTEVLIDSDGKLGKLYGAKTTPHMFVINDQGVLVYAGAIDDKSTTNKADIPGARNHVRKAYEEAKAGKPVSVAATTPYGCSVKYKD